MVECRIGLIEFMIWWQH